MLSDSQSISKIQSSQCKVCYIVYLRSIYVSHGVTYSKAINKDLLSLRFSTTGFVVISHCFVTALIFIECQYYRL